MLKRFFIGLSSRGRIVALVLTMGALYGADKFLANLEERELSAQARHYADAGRLALRRNQSKEAIEEFQRAHDTDRDNRGYELELADALIHDDQPDRAIELVDEMLDEDSNDGAANLLMARAMLEKRRFSNADSYFHRAIYGTWTGNSAQESVKARLELVESLAKRKQDQSLLAELIPLEQGENLDPRIIREIPALYLESGSISHAESAYRALLKNEPENADAYAGLAKAEMQKGNYRAAHQYFALALKVRPDDAALTAEAENARKALELDPTSRHLSSAEKLERSTAILELVLGEVQSCPGEASTDMIHAGQQMLIGKQAKTPTNEGAEARLDLAEKIWQSRSQACPETSETYGLLSALMRKIAE